MKKITFLAGIVFFTLSFGCNKIKQIANINVDIPYSTQLTVPQVPGDPYGVPLPPGGISLTFPEVAVATNAQQYLAQYHTSSSKIVDVYLNSLSLGILSPPSQNFDFLDTVQLYIATKTLPRVLVAYQYSIAKGSNTLNLVTITEVNLKDYFLADTMYLTMGAHINAIPATGTQLNITSKMHLLANPLD